MRTFCLRLSGTLPAGRVMTDRERYIRSLRSQIYELQRRCRAAVWRAMKSAREIRCLQQKYDKQYAELIALFASVEGSSTEGKTNSFLLVHHGEGASQALRTAALDRAQVHRLSPERIELWLTELERAAEKIDRRSIEAAIASIAAELLGAAR